MIWFLHGTLGTSSDWSWVQEKLAQSIDPKQFRNINLWEYLKAGPLSLAEFAEKFCRQVRQENDENPVLCGYSMGGRLALHCLIADNELWKNCFLLGAHPGLQNQTDQLARQQSDKTWATKARLDPWYEFLKTWDAQEIFDFSRESRSYQKSDSRAELEIYRQEIAASFECWSLGSQESLWGRISSVKTKTHWLSGEYDAKFCAVCQAAAKSCLHGNFHQIPDASHRLLLDAPAAVAEILCSELA